MTIKYRDLRKAATTSPPLDALAGGRLAKAHRVRAAHGQLDNLLGNDRNVVARVGLHGNAAFQIVSLNPVNATQRYPLRATYRAVAYAPAFAVLPGHFLRFSALVQPSGMTNKLDGVGGYMADGAYGEIAVQVVWGGPGAQTVLYKIVLPNSAETYAGEDTGSGASWGNLQRVEIPLLFPGTVTTSKSSLRTWSETTTAEVSIAYRGGVRCVDAVVQQVPYAYGRSINVDTTYSSALTTDGAGALVLSYPVAYPVDERSATDPTYGSDLAADIAHRHQTAIGPVLAHWTSWTESSAVTAIVPPSTTTTSTTFVNMLSTSVTAWASTVPGWSLSSAPQQFKSCNALRETRGENGVVPVRVWVYGSRSVATNATVRFQTEAYSAIDVTITTSTPGWWSSTGHLRCGANPQDSSVLQVLGKTGIAASTLSISAVLVEYVDL